MYNDKRGMVSVTRFKFYNIYMHPIVKQNNSIFNMFVYGILNKLHVYLQLPNECEYHDICYNFMYMYSMKQCNVFVW